VLSREQGFAPSLARAIMLRAGRWSSRASGRSVSCRSARGWPPPGHRAKGHGVCCLLPRRIEIGTDRERLRLIAEASAITNRSGEDQLIVLAPGGTAARLSEHHAEAETCFHQALAVARRQQAKSLELRAAMASAGCGKGRVSIPTRTSC
jgi:hypothetical protein